MSRPFKCNFRQDGLSRATAADFMEQLMHQPNPTQYTLLSGRNCHPRLENVNVKLWRYMSLDRLLSILEFKELYHSRMDHLGDPFEGAVTKAYFEKRKQIDKRNLENQQSEDTQQRLHRYLIVRSYVTCWHSSEYESAAMWKLYSNEKTGIAIVSSPQRIKDAVEISKCSKAILGPVEYLDWTTDKMELPYFTNGNIGFAKRKSFEYEKEIRGLVTYGKSIQHPTEKEIKRYSEEHPKGLKLKCNPECLIEDVFICPQASEEFEKLVRTLLRRYSMNVKKYDLNEKPLY